MLKLSTIFKVLAACALLMGFGLVVIGSDNPAPIQPLIQGDGADFELKEELAPVHMEPVKNITAQAPDTKGNGTGPHYINPPDRQGGDDINNAFVLTGQSLPITTTGTTAGFIDDYDEACPYTGSTSPDVVYEFTPSADVIVTIDLCNSGYDTKLYVYENTAGNLVACNDDDCPGYMSTVYDVALSSASTYYIVVDGYGGDNGDYEMNIVEVVPPTGRCCYGAGGLDCADNTEAECAGLGGSWSGALTCATPCATSPDNDECADAIPVSDGDIIDGSTAGATVSCPGVLDWLDLWYAVDAPYASNNINIDYCGTSYDIQCIGIVVYADCGDCNAYIIADNYPFVACGNGTTNPTISWLNMPGPATYYLPVEIADADCNSIEGEFQFAVTVDEVVPPTGRCCYGVDGIECADNTEAECAGLGGTWDGDLDCTTECIPTTAGDNCSDPYEVKLPDDMVDDVFELTSYTCGRVDNYDATCLGYYDGGEDMIIMLDIGVEGTYNFLLSSSTTYKGFSIDDECPDTDNSCIAKATTYSGDVVILNVTLAAGFYYMQIDTWPAPDCIPDFTLTISVAGEPEPGDNWDDCVALAGDVVDLPFETLTATPDGPEGCQYAANRWYCYTPDVTGMATVSLCGSGYDTKLAVYDGIDPYSDPMMGCNDDAPCTGLRSLQSEITDLAFIKDNVYLIEVGGYSSNTGAGVLSISVVDCESPPNDNCEDVTPELLLHGNVVTFTGDNTCATHQCDFFGDPHTWHAFTLPTQMDVTLDYCTTAPAFGNAWLNLSIGCPCDSFTAAGAYDFTTCGDGNVTIVWDDLPAGTYYYPVMKDVGYGSVGPYTLHVVGFAPSELTADPDTIHFGTQPAGSQGSQTLTLGAIGAGDINFSIAYDYSKAIGHVGGLPHLDFGTTDPGPKAPYTGPQNVPSGQKQGGETIATATVIAGLPHSSTGSTAGMVDDYDEACTYTGSTSPDAVYSFTPSASMVVDFTLCNGSSYDTKMYIYENSYTPGAPFACNDDACPGYVSELPQLSLTGGNTYYIVIDGYGGEFGDYVLDIAEYEEPDPFECPPDATPEAEACGADVNGGCNGGAFEPIFCGETKCGTSWADGGTRDTDWYTVEFFVETEVTFTAQSNFYMLMGFVDTSDCGLAAAVDPAGFADPDEIVSVTRTCGPGVYLLFVAHQSYYDYPCGTSNDYWCTLTCPEGPVLWLSADPTSGVVPGGGTLPISVSWDATDLTDGIYNAALKITHDGRGEKIVPVTITIGESVPPDTLVLDPAIIGSYMVNEAVDQEGHIYIGDDLGWVNPLVTSIANGASSIPCTQETIGYHPGLTPPILKLTFDLGDFAEMYDEGLMWDCETRSYTVVGTDDNGAIGAGDEFQYCGHISGDLNLDRVIDIADLVFMVEYMFSGGPAPLVIETADINADGTVDIADLVAFVEYMFMGGDAPQHP